MPTPITATALVLNRRPWSESSQIVTLVTEDAGKFRAVARGVRKLTSDIGPALEPITLSEVVYSRSPRSDLAHVRSAEVLEFFSGLKGSFVRVALAGALCELADRIVLEEEANKALYGHLCTALQGIETTEDRLAINWLWWATIRLAEDVGYAMQFGECVGCRSTERPHPGFASAQGGPVCGKCESESVRSWLPQTQETLIRLSAAEPADLDLSRIPKSVNRGIRLLFEWFFRYHVPEFDRLKSLDMLWNAPDSSSHET